MREELANFEKRLDEQECRIRFNVAVGDLRRLARIGVLTEDALGTDLHRDLLAPSEPSRRKSEYSASIVEAYAAWEAYIENLVQAYINECISGETSHRDDICKQHLGATLEILSSLEKGAPRYKYLSVAGLLECATAVENGSYDRVNSVALIHHVANLRSKTIRELLGRIGAGQAWTAVAEDPVLKKELRHVGLSPAVDYAFSFVDDLCERRNEIAHGGIPQQLLDSEIQLTYIKGLRLVGRKFFQQLYLHAFEPASLHYESIGSFKETYQRRIAIIQALDGVTIRVGDSCVVVSDTTNKQTIREVASIRVADMDVHEAHASENGFEIGVRFDQEIPKVGAVYLRCP